MESKCTISIRGKEFPGILIEGTAYFDKGVSVKAVMEALDVTASWNALTKAVEVK